MHKFAQNSCLLALTALLAGCFMHTVVGNGWGAPSPDKRFSLGISSHGASRKAYVDKTKKNIWLSIYNRENTNSTVLFQQRYILTGLDIDWSIHWLSDEAVSVAFYDWGDGVSNYNHIASLSFVLDRTTGKFVEKK
jgi:hypothetical protein